MTTSSPSIEAAKIAHTTMFHEYLAFTRKNSGYYCLTSVFSVVKKFGFTATESANGALTKIEIQLFGTDKIILTAQ